MVFTTGCSFKMGSVRLETDSRQQYHQPKKATHLAWFVGLQISGVCLDSAESLVAWNGGLEGRFLIHPLQEPEPNPTQRKPPSNSLPESVGKKKNTNLLEFPLKRSTHKSKNSVSEVTDTRTERWAGFQEQAAVIWAMEVHVLRVVVATQDLNR